MEKCRNCDAPLTTGQRYCSECGADSKAKKFSRENDLVAENARLKAENEELKKPKTIPPAPVEEEEI